MKYIFLIASVIFVFTSAAQSKAIRLIIRGDDMGYSHSGNQAIIESYKNGIEQSIEVIVPSPWFPEAVKLLQENSKVDAGVHLAITSEWDNIKWRPLTDCKSITDPDGYFFPMVYPNKNYPGRSINENHWLLADIEKEFRAQIELAIKKIPRISHVSAHMGCTYISDSVKVMTKNLAKEYKIDIDLEEHNVKYVSYEGEHKTAAEKISSFIKMIEKLEAGNTYLFLDHPGFDNEELKAIQHIGYEDVAADRQGVTELFTSEKIKKILRQKNIELISYKDLAGDK